MVSLINRYPPYEKLRTKTNTNEAVSAKDPEEGADAVEDMEVSSETDDSTTKASEEVDEKVEDVKKPSKQATKRNAKASVAVKEEVKEAEKVPGIEEGQRSQKRIKLSELRVHIPPGKKLKITTHKVISVILIQDVSAFYRYENLKKFSFKRGS